jgi:hypothetical protein
MEGLHSPNPSAAEQLRSWKPVDVADDADGADGADDVDVVSVADVADVDRMFGPLFVPRPPVFVRSAEPPRLVETVRPTLSTKDREIISQQRAQEAIVVRELALGRDPEQYWERLCEEFAIRASQCQEMEGLGMEMTRDRAIIQKVRWEMNALIPKLAEARVRKDAQSLSFADPKMYADRLARQYAHAEQTAASAAGDEIALRSAIDNARIVREQLSALRRLTANPEAWRFLRMDAVHKVDRSVLDEYPANEIVPVEPWRAQLMDLRAARAKLGFFDYFKKKALDEKIAPLARMEERKARAVAGPR